MATWRFTIPTANESVKGGIKIGEGLAMDGETLNVSGANDSAEKKKSINIKNIIKGSGGTIV